ncbi:MAG: type II toxin-antitoxin system prevent-host-death family antitoxin [Alphaproteobacteria bacterium]|jgi:prevent-host-death family protein
MREIGAFDAKNTLGSLLDMVQRGEQVLITRHGKPVARLVPDNGTHDRTAAKAAVERIRARGRARTSEPISSEEWIDYRNEGRP